MQRSASYEIPHPQEAAESDVFDRAGIYVPTAVSAVLLLLLNYCNMYFFLVSSFVHAYYMHNN